MNVNQGSLTGLVLKEPILFELKNKGAIGIDLPPMDVNLVDPKESLEEELLRGDVESFPELSEPEVVRHFSRLSTWNYSLDGGFYPLGSCTMKYNPRCNEVAASLEGFSNIHPYLPDQSVQGMLELLYDLQHDLAEMAGLEAISLHPAAGSHGELLGLMLIQAYYESRGEHDRKKILIPDSAHGTNPSSAAICKLEPVELVSGKDGLIDMEELDKHMDESVAGIMITNPNTCGLFEEKIKEISDLVHSRGGLVYMDGANMNALIGKTKPGLMGVDVLHFNTHKTFSTPHGGGGPGAGPIAVHSKLEKFLPTPILVKNNEQYGWDYDRPESIGKIRSFHGNIGVLIRAYCYIKTMGDLGLEEMTETAVVNANYLKKKLEAVYDTPFNDRPCMHEVLFSDRNLAEKGLSTMDIAKGLIDRGFHPPTVYFPLIVHGAMLVEPTETESKETLDRFIQTMIELANESHDKLSQAPKSSYVGRVNEVQAARKPIVKWEQPED